MGGKGPAPKPANIRQRQNKKAGATTLSAGQLQQGIPLLPPIRIYQALTNAWWEKVWNSPMAPEYLETDIDGLARLAMLIDNFYILVNDPLAWGKAKELLSEIRLQEARFGLSPVDRSRLQWEVQKGEEAQAKRQAAQQPRQSSKGGGSDPRFLLGQVSS